MTEPILVDDLNAMSDTLTLNPDSDDDAVIITLNDQANPAISPFRYPPMMTTTLHGG